jgi:hypothetical protein
MADSMQRSAAAGYRSVQAGAAAGYDAVADRARRAASTVTESTRAAGQRTLETGTTLLDFCREQPLVLAGLGLAAGAMIGALMPSTEIEDRAMGETSDRLKEGAQNLASEQYDAAKKVGEHAIDAAQDEAAKQADKLKAAAETQNGAGEQNEHETKSEEPTLAPAQPAGGEWRGEPWTAENAPR